MAMDMSSCVALRSFSLQRGSSVSCVDYQVRDTGLEPHNRGWNSRSRHTPNGG